MMEPQVVSLLTSWRTAGLETRAEMIERVLIPMVAIITPETGLVSGTHGEERDEGTEENRMHSYFVGYAVPGAEGGHYGCDSYARDDGCCEGFVEGEDAVEDSGCCYEHGEVINFVSLV